MAVFYKLCKHDGHTCINRECLKDPTEDHCEMEKKPAVAPTRPIAPSPPVYDDYCC